MKDRISASPGRVLITPESGAAFYATVTRADNPTQEGDSLSKNTLLKDTTAEALGLSDAALPDDALRIISRLHAGLGNEYLWAKISTSSGIVLGNQVTTTINTGATIYYSAEVDFSSGSAELVNPSATYPQVSGVAGILEGMYYTLPENAEGVYKFVSIVVGSTAAVTGNLVSYSTAQEIVGYVNSPNPNAYPPAVDDGYTYTALGMLGEKARIATGSYTGTGTYGASNKKTITVGFKPELVIVWRGSGSTPVSGGGYWSEMAMLLPNVNTKVNGSSNVLYTTFTDDGVDFYNTASASANLNVSGDTYYYFAIS